MCVFCLFVCFIDRWFFYQRKKREKKKRGYIAKKTSQKRSKDMNRLRYLSPGMQVNARYINSALRVLLQNRLTVPCSLVLCSNRILTFENIHTVCEHVKNDTQSLSMCSMLRMPKLRPPLKSLELSKIRSFTPGAGQNIASRTSPAAGTSRDVCVCECVCG